MIIGFKHKALRRLYETGSPKGLQSDLVGRIEVILATMDSARNLDPLSLPSLRLHQLKGDRKDTWSVSVSGQWRITFTHDDGQFDNINLEDYH
jgi:proteic killer suppression protein